MSTASAFGNFKIVCSLYSKDILQKYWLAAIQQKDKRQCNSASANISNHHFVFCGYCIFSRLGHNYSCQIDSFEFYHLRIALTFVLYFYSFDMEIKESSKQRLCQNNDGRNQILLIIKHLVLEHFSESNTSLSTQYLRITLLLLVAVVSRVYKCFSHFVYYYSQSEISP